MEKRSNRNIPGKFDPNTCMDTILPKWSLKSVNNSKKKTQILSGSMTESKVLFHKEAKNKEDDKLNSYNIPKKFYKSPIIPSPNRNYRDNYVKSFPLDQSSTLRTYGPIEIPSLPQLTDSEMMNISLTSPIMNDRSKYDKKSDPRYLILDDSKLLPLMCFDNSEYERYSPEEWLELCKTGYSTFYNKGSWYWVPCEIKSYDKETERFHIDFTSFKVEKDVSRLNLRFDLENEEEFNMRLEEAVRLRNQTKYDLRYEYYVSTENIDLSPINPAWLDNIYIRMVSNTYLGLSKHKSRILEIGKEIIENYNLNMKRVSINTQLLFDDEKLDNYMKMDFKLPTNERTVNEYGKYQIGQLSFDDYQNEVAKSPQLLKKEIYKILHTIQELWMNRIGDILLVDLDNLKLPCKLSELVDKQINYCKSIVDLIREKWYLHVKDTIIDNLQTIYDFYIANKLDYDKTEMSRVLHLFDNVCRTYLQKILMRSVEKWTEFLYKYEPKDEASEYCRDSAEKVNPEYEEYMEKQRIVEEKKLEEIERQKQMEEEKKKGEKDRKRKTGRGIAVQEDFEEEVEEKEEIIVKVTECLLPLKYFYKRPESNTTWGSWDTNLFDIKLIPKESEITMSPTREELSKSLIRVIRNMVEKISTLNKIEPQIVPLVYLPPEPLLNLEDEESPIYYMREEINEYCELVSFLIEKSMIGPKSILDRYQLYADAIPTNAIEYGKPFDGVPDIETIRNEIEKFYIAKKNISKETYDEEPFGLCLLDCRKVKNYYIKLSDLVEDELVKKILKNIYQKCSVRNDEFDEMMKKVNKIPQNEEELVEIKQFISTIDQSLMKVNKEVDLLYEQLSLLSQFFYKVPDREFNLIWESKKWPKKIKTASESSILKLDRNKMRMQEKLEKEKERFTAQISQYDSKLKSIYQYGDWDQVEKIFDIITLLDNELKEAKGIMDDINKREEIFGWESTSYPILKETIDLFQPHLEIWTMAADFKANRDYWLTSPFINLDGNEIDNNVNTWWTSSYKLFKKMEKEYPNPARIAKTLREQTDEFRKNVPIIRALASKALQERHWEQLSEIMKVRIVPDEELTLNLLVEFNIMGYWDKVQEITVYAEKEYNLERSLESMQNQWDEIKFELMSYRNTGTYVLKGVEDIMMLLDDHIVKTQTMMGSPYIGAIKSRCKSWEKKLQYAQSLIDEWLMCQRTWMSLEPIFGSEDIMRQMPTESRRFQAVDNTWRSTMSETYGYPKVMDSAGKDKLLDKFKSTNKMLDQIQKGLNDYLEVKRLSFPRFYFLANNELLEILSQTKDPRTVQRYLSKCFEGINSVVFNCDIGGAPSDVTITTMVSSEGEKVDLLNKVNPNEGGNRGNVEKWLLELESSMRLTIKDIVMKSIKDYSKKPRSKWVLNWPGQIILNVSQLMWTSEVTEAIKENYDDSLPNYKTKLNKQLSDIVELVRGDLSSMDRLSLSALTVIDVHARDIIELLIEQEVEEEDDFNWMAQLRYYWEVKIDEYERYGKDNNNLLARIVNAEVMYGYEYLGNSTRLVITPLTDRCYRTMMGAVSLDYGGAPAGPAGTGKTETVKDLSKAVAIQCVVFNCSDGLDYLAMAKFFKGLAASGAWACFDEFNRIELEVLSVIAQQLLTILKAKRARLKRFLFEGSNIPLNPDCNSFITMNPGYAGRTELPDNLKALFRSCAMMVPDYAMIAEIKLYSFGFSDARNMARKLTQVLKLCSEQLSSQKHYDYGMRAVFSILIRAGNLRQERNWTEDLLVLSAIIDVNLPKFTANDITLFQGILSDLFPGVILPEPDYGPLIPTITNNCLKQNLQPKTQFTKSIVQLWETVVVRHGLMIVGETYSGKTKVMNTLAISLRDNMGVGPYTDVKITTMNPKSITQGQLYGYRDDNTGEWFDGVLASVFRTAAENKSPIRQWLVFDGPVDAVWIENMNTVLDDNKKLCLNSGEIIKMTNYMTMIFEASDLEEASPATVSRCGMVYLEQQRLGWEALVDSWLNEIIEKKENDNNNVVRNDETNVVEETEEEEGWASKEDKIQMKRMFNWLIPPLLYIAKSEIAQLTPITPMEYMASCLRLLDCFISMEFYESESPPTGKQIIKVIEGYIIMSIIWSIGAVTNAEGRQIFDRVLKSICIGNMQEDEFYQNFIKKNPGYLQSEEKEDIIKKSISQRLPEGSIYNYQFIGKTLKWQLWTVLMKDTAIPEDISFNSIIIPTVDTVRTNYIFDVLYQHQKHILLTGETGTGKSILINSKLLNNLSDNYMFLTLNFSAQTSANMTQDIIDGKLMKRRKGVFGPPVGKTCLIFVDDLNMPSKETYGAQPPIEILRQWMDHGGWYDRKSLEFTRIIDVQFIAAMGPPGGGRTLITQRYVRHFNVIGMVPFDNESLKRIYTKIVDWIMIRYPNSYKVMGNNLIEATLSIYEIISKELLPTPTKSHYTFNLRDLSKVFQGISMCAVQKIEKSEDMIRLWGHECLRVFHDRLIDDKDRKWFTKTLSTKCDDVFMKDWNKQIKGDNDTLIYGNFIDPNANPKLYGEIKDRKQLQSVMDEYLEDYNQTHPNHLNLVLFQNAIEHIARISRIIHQPYGNALLVGVGGSGKKSLATIATYIADYQLYKIEITKSYGKTEWKEDLKKILKITGLEAKPLVFLFSDTQIVNESFIEDINNLLNSGEVPNLFESDEQVQLLEEMSAAAQKAGKNPGIPAEVYNYFIERSRTNLHLVLAFSPIGDAFRTRLRMFPSLVNCCTIDWFTNWPEEALRSVADYFLNDVEIEDKEREGVINICVDMQEGVTKLTKKFLNELGRHYYVTPTSYLELIKTFKILLSKKRDEVNLKKKRYDNGLQKLFETQEQVTKMQEDLKELQPKLRVAQDETEIKLKTVESMQHDTDEKKKIVQTEENECKIQADSAEEMERDCSEQLAVAIPAMEAAIAALKTLDKSSLVEVKSMKNPPAGVKLTMETVCILLGIKPKRVFDESGMNKIDDYWEVSQKQVLSNTNLLKTLQEYDKDNIPIEIINKITPYIERADFEPAIVTKASVAAGGLCKWVHAIVKYDVVAKIVAPKKAALEIARKMLGEANLVLDSKRAELNEIIAKLKELERELEITIQKKIELENRVEDCKRKLDRAQRLLGGLGGEQTRWTEFSKNLSKDFENLVGDLLISSGVIAYLGYFPTAYRNSCIEDWLSSLDKYEISHSQLYSLSTILGDQIQIRKWTITKLPNDSFSIDNAIMLFQSDRWPLMVDPEGQANRWIRNLEGTNNLKIVKQSSNTFVRTLENSIQFGAPLLLENLPEVLDPILETILLKQIITVGGMKTIRIGDNSITYDNRFRLYMTTKLRNPHYSPETCVKVNLLNFMATQEGLQDQMLGILVGREQEELEKRREQLVLEDAENKRKLKEIEDEILNLLAQSEGDILEDEKLIDTLAQSKITGNQIQIAVSRAESTQREMMQVRKNYEPVAERASLLFFCISDLSGIESMYQYSMDWFINLYLLSIVKAPKSSNIKDRLLFLNDTFTYLLYENICRSLFEKDKLLFSFLLCNKILIANETLNPLMLRYLLTGSLSMALSEPNPINDEPKWLSDKSWNDILGLKSIPTMEKFQEKFKSNIQAWEKIYYSSDPILLINDILVDYSTIQKLLVLKIIRSDKVIPTIQQFISEQIGRKYIEIPPNDLIASYHDSNNCSPLIFILSPGSAPMNDLLKLAEKMGMSKKLNSVSLGQGQGPIAEEAISIAIEKGMWVCLQNCHLADSWMPEMERICEEFSPERCHPDFRLWLTSMPSNNFPSSILQNGVKMTTEPPKGLLNNLQGTYNNIEPDWFESCSKPFEFKKLLFGLAFFHATVRERVKFGPLGWNIPYVFAESDLQISMDQLKLFLNKYEVINFEMLNYLAGECNYGGRVTDDKDRRCLINILTDFYTPDIVEDQYKFSPSGIYYAPEDGPLESYLEYIKTLPLNEHPEVYGFHENADITSANQETARLLEIVLSLQPKTMGATGQSWESQLQESSQRIIQKIPNVFDIEKISVKYPVVYEESLNTVLVQELMRFNGLLSVVKKSLVDIQKAIKGLVVMSQDLEMMGNSMVNGWVPEKWKAVAYPSLKPLGSWVQDLCARVDFLNSWIENGPPNIFWISGFFFTQSFLTGTRQNYARRHTIPIDEISYDFKVFSKKEQEQLNDKPADGCYIKGLFLEGANWDDNILALNESNPKELFVEMPVIHLLPKRTDEIDEENHIYECPCYKTSERRGVLSTTGHSTNFVMMINLPMMKEHTQKHWIKRGVALLTQLDA